MIAQVYLRAGIREQTWKESQRLSVDFLKVSYSLFHQKKYSWMDTVAWSCGPGYLGG